MNIVTKPFYWVSAHREVKFVFDYEHVYDLTAVFGADGFAVFAFDSDGINAQEVGDLIYIDSGIYKGYHKITEIYLFPNWYKTETVYTDNQNTGTLTFIEDHIFTINAGYDSGDLATLFPIKQIAEFKSEPNLDGQLVVDISGYISRQFDVIDSNDTTTVGALTVYYNTFRQIQLLIDDTLVSTHIALNSAITMFELNRDYVDTGRSLNGGSLGNHFLSCGESINQFISGEWVIAGEAYEGGSVVPLGPDFDVADFDPADFKAVGG